MTDLEQIAMQPRIHRNYW